MLISVVAVLALLAGCSSNPPQNASAGTTANSRGPSATVNEGTPVTGGGIVIGVPAESSGYNPAANQWTDSGNLVGSSVLEPLLAFGADKQAKPWLAESWTPNATNTSWTITLRPNVVFHSGEKFDAAAVKTNFDYFMKSPLTSLALTGMLDSVNVVDGLTVRFDMKKPWGAFPNSMLDGPLYMMAPSMLAAEDQGQTRPVGTGPFRFESWQRDSSFKVVKNPNYWQQGLPRLDAIEFRMIPDDSARLSALNSGDVDVILSKRASDAVAAEGKSTVVKDWNSENVFAQANTSPTIDGVGNPLANIRARKALAYATDREAVAASIGDGIDIPTSPWGPESPWGMPDSKNNYVDFDLPKAKAEVEAYKQETGQPSLDLTLIGFASTDDLKLMQVLQSQWNAAGANVSLQQFEESAFITKTITSNYQIAISRNYAFPDPDTAYSFWSSTTARGSGNLSINMTQFTTAQLDQALEKGRESTDLQTRKDAYNEVTRQLNGAFTHVWLYRTPYSLIAQPQVKGWNTPRTIGFSSYGPRTWLAELWLSR